MPRAVAVGLTEPALQISTSPRDTNHISIMRASGSGRRPIATLIFGSKHSTLLGWIRCPHSPVLFTPTTMASSGHSLSNGRRISAGSRLAIAEAMLQCFAFRHQTNSRRSGAPVCREGSAAGAGWGLMDVDGGSKVALEALCRVWASVAVVLSNAGLSGVRIDLHNDTPDSLPGELVLVATNFLGQRTVEARRVVSIPGRSSLTFFDSSLSGAFRDLLNSFRSGQPTVDGIEAVVEFVGSPYMIRDALIVNPRPGQANSGISALAYPSDETDWTLEISSDLAHRYVSIDAPGWQPSDDFFHLLAAAPYIVRLQRCCDQAAPLDKVASVDSLGTDTITASA